MDTQEEATHSSPRGFSIRSSWGIRRCWEIIAVFLPFLVVVILVVVPVSLVQVALAFADLVAAAALVPAPRFPAEELQQMQL